MTWKHCYPPGGNAHVTLWHVALSNIAEDKELGFRCFLKNRL
jgi:hypothetical protein